MRHSLVFAAVAGLGLGIYFMVAPKPAPAQSTTVQDQSGVEDAAPAATASGSVEFNLFALDGFGQFRQFTFDADYTERFGIPVPQPFRLSLPINDALELISDGAPDDGYAKFTWVAGEGAARRFVGNVVVYTADWPQADTQVRLDAVQALIRDNVFARATAAHGGGDLKGWGDGMVNGIPVVQAAGTYTDAQWGPMLLRIVAFPNPEEGPSYFVLNNVSLDMVPIVHLDQMRSTLGGQALLSFTYLPSE